MRCPTLLPGGRPVTDDAARAEVEQAWGLPPARCRPTPGRDTAEMLAAAAVGELAALVVGGVDPHDLPDPAAALAGLREVGFLVSLELHTSRGHGARRRRAPGGAGRAALRQLPELGGPPRPFGPALDASGVLPDCRVLDTLAVEMDVDLFTQTPAAAASELDRLGRHVGVAPPGAVAPVAPSRCGRSSSGRRCWPRGAS